MHNISQQSIKKGPKENGQRERVLRGFEVRADADAEVIYYIYSLSAYTKQWQTQDRER